MTLEFVPFGLFDFQEEEVDRLFIQKSRLLAWEMGTGKTYGGAALDVENKGRSKAYAASFVEPDTVRKTLIICPKSVIDVWDQHCMELTDQDVYVIDTNNRAPFLRDVRNPNRGGYFIIHWEGIRILRDELCKIKFFHVIADECHRAKNRKAQQTLALKAIPTLYKTALSGTPADNKPHDLWSVLNWLWPKVYTSYWNFFKAYMVQEVDYRQDGTKYNKISGVKNVEHLREQMAPWYSRKLKKDVLKDLPDKYYTTIWTDLHPKQAVAYKQMQNTMVAWVQEHEDEIDHPLIAQVVITQLVRLQQFAVGYMVPQLDEDGKQKYKFTWPKGTPKEIKEQWAGKELEAAEHKLCRATPLFDMIDPSSKLDVLMELLEDNPDEQIVVFSQFKSVISLLGKRLTEKGVSHGLYTGDTSQEDRGKLVRSFQEGSVRVFAGTVAAGGVGITLTGASIVVFLDRSWSPALNAQAEDRLHRIGQKNAVQVIDIMAKGTVDIARRDMLAQKMGWLREILGDKVAAMLERKELGNEFTD